MTNSFVAILTITADHEFSNTVHHSVHVSHKAAQDYADDVVLPRLRANEEPEYRNYFSTAIATMPVLGHGAT